MFKLQTLLSFVATGSMALAAVPHADAAIMLDFGPTTPTGSTANSPLHASTSFTETVWNTLGTADSSTILNSDGTAATGVAVNLGSVSGAIATIIDLDDQPSTSSALGSAANTGVYSGTSVGKDGIFDGGSNDTTRLGVQVTGLAAGTYDVYLTGRNTNTGVGQSHTVTLFAGAGATGDFDSALLASESLTYTNPNLNVDAWVAGENYSKFTVTLTAGQALNIASAGSVSPNSARGFLNSAQIVLIPEPGSMVLVGLGGLLMFKRRRMA